MKVVIDASPLAKKNTEIKPTVITDFIDSRGEWINSADPYGLIKDESELRYLGNCSFDGDMFALHYDGQIIICKGHLNDGVI